MKVEMKVEIEPRQVESRRLTIAITAISALFALPIISIVFVAYGVNPLIAFQKIFDGSFGSMYSFSETVAKAIPLMAIAIGLSLAFQTLVYNIGAEGQLVMGAIFATAVALNFPSLPAYVLVPSLFAVGFVGGALWSFLPGILKAKFQVNEVITTLMMNYVATKILEYLVYGPWRGKGVMGFPYTDEFSASGTLPTIGDTRVHYPTLIIALLAAAVIYIIVTRTKLGFEIRVAGKNPDAAKYVGISCTRIITLVMLVSGGLAGIAGVGEVAGIQHRLRLGVSQGHGFTAIIVAWLGKLHPLSTIIVSILYGALLVGGEMLQVSLGLPIGIVQMFNGIFLFSVLGGELLLRNKISIKLRTNENEGNRGEVVCPKKRHS